MKQPGPMTSTIGDTQTDIDTDRLADGCAERFHRFFKMDFIIFRAERIYILIKFCGRPSTCARRVTTGSDGPPAAVE